MSKLVVSLELVLRLPTRPGAKRIEAVVESLGRILEHSTAGDAIEEGLSGAGHQTDGVHFRLVEGYRVES